MMKHRRPARTSGTVVLAVVMLTLVASAVGPAIAEPPSERTLISAVADESLDRILVRWLQVEGTARRFTHYDVLRRESDQATFSTVNPDPVGAMTTVAAIQILFNTPGYEDALASIQDSLGSNYASDLLQMQSMAAGDTATAQYKLLPDLNYGAAITFGFGLMDHTVVNGTTYVYEVWGLDELGYRVERLGRATATAGAPEPFEEVTSLDCVDLGDARGHMSATLRWEEPPSTGNRNFGGYDIYRAALAGDDCTTTPNGPGAPGAVKANRYPTSMASPGQASLGSGLFISNCAGCHAASDPRNTAPDTANSSLNGVKGGTIGSFRRLQYPELVSTAHHDTAVLNALSSDSVRAIFDWIHQFQFMDDGYATPLDPLVEGDTYCYRILPRNLLGHHVTDGIGFENQPCPVLDLESPDTPSRIASQRTVVGDYEICEISWQRNARPDDDTVDYLLYRMTDAVPRAHSDPGKRVAAPDPKSDPALLVIPQPGTGERVTHQDVTLSIGDAGQRYFYAAMARDEAGNTSGFSGWVPCVPRDIVAPPPTELSVECCAPSMAGCENKVEDVNWIDAGGQPIIIWDPAVTDGDEDCPDGRIRITATHPDDTFGVRLYRSFYDHDYRPGADFKLNIIEGFNPTIDAKIWAKGRGYDRSGNLASQSIAVSWIVVGKLPAPMIESIALLASLPGYVKIKFRTLAPENLLGFALYRYNKTPSENIPTDLSVYNFVVRHHDVNLSVIQANPGEWAVQSGATTLDHLLPSQEPTTDTYLYYDDLNDLYVLQTEVLNLDLNGLVFGLTAVSWSGREGDFQPYTIQSHTDGVLDWPQIRQDNVWLFTDDLAASWNPGDASIDLTWTAYPNGCLNDDIRPFIVFRRRGSSPNWEQISPPFRCDSGNTSMLYKDYDVQSGFTYRYVVIRLGASGEFDAQFGAREESVP